MASATAPLTFGPNYAVLNLDWMTVLINAAKDTPEGQALITNCCRWNDAVHQKSPRPLTLFTTLSFNAGQPEVQLDTPFANLIAPYGEFRHGSPEVQIFEQFNIDEEDVVLSKTRWCATVGNPLEQILKARGIKTVIIVLPSFALLVDSTVSIFTDILFIVRPDSLRRHNVHYLPLIRPRLRYLRYQG